ncbi:MAG TPA: NAD(P)-dependent oxidoreductase [Fimbriiglobus sp.]|jgi:nucleoside-diphosphate-sugar epimerase|nr:NAD(P)-dependent oxidoreductase [Fimbriiglobus sp.]
MTPRVLITGGTGFIGLPCTRRAIDAGAEVHVLARHRPDTLPESAAFHEADFTKPTTFVEACHAVRPTHLLHLAWVTAPGAYWSAPENRDWQRESFHLVLAFRQCGGRRAAVAGTCAEYDWSAGGVCRESRTPTRPATLYGTCKSELRHELVALSERFELSLAWPRLFFLYGPREHPARLVPSVTNALLAGRPAETTAGTQERDFLHVEDAADALVRLLLSDVSGPVNIGSGEPVAVRTVVEAVADIIGRPDLLRLGAKPTPPNEPPQLYADVGRLRNEVEWTPRIGLRQGLADTVAWWRDSDAA